jgi:tetratricopeptide (TPR) repeat protein
VCSSDLSADWNCATFTIVQDKLSADGSIAARSLMRGPYAKQALADYERALSFSPNDTIIRCNVAGINYTDGQKLPMQQLEDDSYYRSNLGNSYLDLGKEAAFGSNPSVASGYFHLAMKEFDAALSIDPLNIGALNGYGYTYWTWKLLAARAKVSENPDAQIGETAERYARGAYAQAKDKLPKSSEMSYLDTLWEVLLARGHPEDAITQLAPLMKDNLVSNSPYTDEMRWDMAQAYLCATAHAERNAVSPQTAQQWNDQARFYLDAIKQHEASRDLQSFGRDPSLLDATVLSACFQ